MQVSHSAQKCEMRDGPFSFGLEQTEGVKLVLTFQLKQKEDLDL